MFMIECLWVKISEVADLLKENSNVQTSLRHCVEWEIFACLTIDVLAPEIEKEKSPERWRSCVHILVALGIKSDKSQDKENMLRR